MFSVLKFHNQSASLCEKSRKQLQQALSSKPPLKKKKKKKQAANMSLTDAKETSSSLGQYFHMKRTKNGTWRFFLVKKMFFADIGKSLIKHCYSSPRCFASNVALRTNKNVLTCNKKKNWLVRWLKWTECMSDHFSYLSSLDFAFQTIYMGSSPAGCVKLI